MEKRNCTTVDFSQIELEDDDTVLIVVVTLISFSLPTYGRRYTGDLVLFHVDRGIRFGMLFARNLFWYAPLFEILFLFRQKFLVSGVPCDKCLFLQVST